MISRNTINASPSSYEGEDPPVPVERFTEVLEDLRAKILDGTHPIGEPLPHTERLKETYGVSAAVITRVMKELKAEGLIWRVANRGMIVEPPPVAVDLPVAIAPHHEHQRWREACEHAGITGRIDEFGHTFRIGAVPSVAQPLGIAEDDPIMWWLRVAVVNEQLAVFYDRIYYPWAVLGDVPPGTSIPQSQARALSRINPNTCYADITTTVRPILDDESNLFRLSEGMPIYDITRVIRDEHGRPIELVRRLANPLRVRLVERGLAL
ncbi:GntR family transcriptional regulator [Sphaerisporangium viridialbum]|uniref:GntR family transcriptional regulator n=1 Tax=Sphaerisporangium viridialbum TaxID=46189 RepID=UPI003C7200CB